MTAASFLSDLDHAVINALSENPALVAYRTALRGGDGQGKNLTTGPVPVVLRGRYALTQGSLPCAFVTETATGPSGVGGLIHIVSLTVILPSHVGGGHLSSSDIEEGAELVRRALLVDRTLGGYSVPDKLMASGMSSAIEHFQVLRLGVEGDLDQHRIVAQVQFTIPPGAALGTQIGIG